MNEQHQHRNEASGRRNFALQTTWRPALERELVRELVACPLTSCRAERGEKCRRTNGQPRERCHKKRQAAAERRHRAIERAA